MAGASSEGTVTFASSLLKGVYNPKAFIPHAASLHQTFVHCARFPIAASRRSGGRVSVPLWLAILSDQLPVIGLVGRYPANYLIGREPLFRRPDESGLSSPDQGLGIVCGINLDFSGLDPTGGQVAHALFSRLPLYLTGCPIRSRSTCMH